MNSQQPTQQPTQQPPQAPRSKLRLLAAVVGTVLSALYLLNLSFGMLEIPDNLPIIGNLDEVAVSAVFYGCLRYLGIDLIPFQRPR